MKLPLQLIRNHQADISLNACPDPSIDDPIQLYTEVLFAA